VDEVSAAIGISDDEEVATAAAAMIAAADVSPFNKFAAAFKIFS
jgi:hypothetical protein